MYQLNFIKIIKKTLQKNLVKDIKVSLKKIKGSNMVMNTTKIHQNMKTNYLLSVENIPYYNYKKLFSL